MDWTTGWIALITCVGAVLGSLGTMFGKFLLDIYKLRNTNMEKREVGVVTVYQAVVLSLQTEVNINKERIDKLTDAHVRCREDNARLETKVNMLEKQLQDLTALYTQHAAKENT